MSSNERRVAVVTGANQGLGLALIEGLCRRLTQYDVVYLTGRDEARGHAAVADLQTRGLTPRFARVDVRDAHNVSRFADQIAKEHGGVDIVISNAARMMFREIPFAEQVRDFVETSNFATTRMIENFGPLLRDNARFLVIASALGRLRHLPETLGARFREADTLGAIDQLMADYVTSVENGTAETEGWPTWINIPPKIGQVATTRLYAQNVRKEANRRGIIINAVCPGLIDTPLSRPWFEDMSTAQSPHAAAEDVLWLTKAPSAELPYGELVQHRKVLSFDS